MHVVSVRMGNVQFTITFFDLKVSCETYYGRNTQFVENNFVVIKIRPNKDLIEIKFI